MASSLKAFSTLKHNQLKGDMIIIKVSLHRSNGDKDLEIITPTMQFLILKPNLENGSENVCSNIIHIILCMDMDYT